MDKPYEFKLNARLGIELPFLYQKWHQLSEQERAAMLYRWELIRGRIPDRIMHLEEQIREKQQRLNVEDDFTAACRLNSQISDLASIICDLHLWYRVDQHML
jgi:hypothetical protein